jgi:hypothetical protein
LQGVIVAECLIAILVQVACVFGASAFAKVRSAGAYLEFRTGLSRTSLVAPSGLRLVAATLAAAEVTAASVLAAAALLVMTTAQPTARTVSLVGLTVALALTCVLTAGVAVVVRRGVIARCACFGASSASPLGVAHLIRNTVLLAAEVLGLAIARISASSHITPAGTALAVLVGLVAALPLLRWEDLVALFAAMPSTASASPRVDSAPRS